MLSVFLLFIKFANVVKLFTNPTVVIVHSPSTVVNVIQLETQQRRVNVSGVRPCLGRVLDPQASMRLLLRMCSLLRICLLFRTWDRRIGLQHQLIHPRAQAQTRADRSENVRLRAGLQPTQQLGRFSDSVPRPG